MSESAPLTTANSLAVAHGTHSADKQGGQVAEPCQQSHKPGTEPLPMRTQSQDVSAQATPHTLYHPSLGRSARNRHIGGPRTPIAGGSNCS